MKKKLSLSEARKLYPKRDYGDHKWDEVDDEFRVEFMDAFPDVTFIIPKVFSFGCGGVATCFFNPIRKILDRELPMHLIVQRLDHFATMITFGDYQREDRCFRPQSPVSATHMLIIEYGRPGRVTMKAKQARALGAVYFRRIHNDTLNLWIIPVDAVYRWCDKPEGSIHNLRRYCDALLRRDMQNDQMKVWEQAWAENESFDGKPKIMPKLQALKERLNALRDRCAFNGIFGRKLYELTDGLWFELYLDDEQRFFFLVDEGYELDYTEENYAALEVRVIKLEKLISSLLAEGGK